MTSQAERGRDNGDFDARSTGVDAGAEPIKYGQAIEELQRILGEIEGDGVDLDDLALKVERAAHLIQVCRQKIRDTEMQVNTIIEGLDEGSDS